MVTSHTFSVTFYLKHGKGSHGRVPIYARVTVNGQRAELSVKHSIDPKHWSSEKGLAIGRTRELQELNTFLEQLRSVLVKCYQELLLQRKLISAATVKQSFLGLFEQEHSLNNLFVYHRTNNGSLAKGTMKNYGATEKYLRLFLRFKFATDDISLSQLSYNFIVSFETFLRGTPGLDKNRPLTNNGIMKHLERLKKLVNLAVRLEWLERDPFQKYQLKFTETDRESLTQDELDAIEQVDLQNETWRTVRDMFVFSCYTALAYIDVVQLKPDNIQIGIDGDYWIFMRRAKSNKPVRVPLLPKAMELLDRYGNHPKSKLHGTMFPMISNQKVNGYLKKIAAEAKINKNLTFHLARHTFATTVTLTNGVPIESVSKMMGHSTVRTTQIYAKVIEQKISSDMADLRLKLSGNKLLK